MRSNREILANVYDIHGMRYASRDILQHPEYDSQIIKMALMAMTLARDEEGERLGAQIEGLKKNNEHLAEANRLFADENHELKRALKEH